MTDNVSPEEKLLKLIKGEKRPPVSDNKITADAAEVKPALKHPLPSFARTYLTAVNIQKLIPAFLAVAIAYLLISFVYPFVGLNNIKLPKVTSPRKQESGPKPEEEAKPLEFYLQGVSQREIFGNPVGSNIEETVVPQGQVEADLLKDINLMGIISGLTPQAVIEDKKAQKTYYVTKGQFIGEMQVEDIAEGKIILNYKGKRFELYL